MANLCAEGPITDARLAVPEFRADIQPFPSWLQDNLSEYAACRTLQGESDACSVFGVPGKEAQQDLAQCRTLAAEYVLASKIVQGGDALSACRSLQKLEGEPGPASDKKCAALIRTVRAEGASLACAKLEAEGLIDPRNPCVDFQIYWSGVPAKCEHYKQDSVAMLSCRRNTAYVAGLRSTARCGASPFCLALTTKSSKACAPLLDRFSQGLCAVAAKGIEADARMLVRKKELLEEKRVADAAETARAKEAAKAAREKAEVAAKQAALDKLMMTHAAKAAATEAKIRAKEEAAKKKDAEVKAKIERLQKRQFQSGEPMVEPKVEFKVPK